MPASQKRIAYHTLGCKLNFSETSELARVFEKQGYERRAFDQEADVYVINTCSVTENADKECHQLIRRVRKQNPSSRVVVTGCYAQLQPERIASIPGVDLVVGTQEKFNLPAHVASLEPNSEAKIFSCDIEEVERFHAAYSLKDRTRTFLKVQDGCDYTCSFCTIPKARGRSRSDSIEGVLANVNELAAAGVKEVVLTGVNLGDFGRGYQGGRNKEAHFLSLMRALDEQALMPRFRISSIEPNLLSEEIIAHVASSKRWMPHFHIPLQSGSNTILAGMRRRYRAELYADRVAVIRKLIPWACIGADVIVGFPGETDHQFQITYDFLEQLSVNYLHVFTYSERPDTDAIQMNDPVPVRVRRERNAVLRELSAQKMLAFRKAHNQQTRDVLFESNNQKGFLEGYTDNYIQVQVPWREDWINQIISYTLPDA